MCMSGGGDATELPPWFDKNEFEAGGKYLVFITHLLTTPHSYVHYCVYVFIDVFFSSMRAEVVFSVRERLCVTRGSFSLCSTPSLRDLHSPGFIA